MRYADVGRLVLCAAIALLLKPAPLAAQEADAAMFESRKDAQSLFFQEGSGIGSKSGGDKSGADGSGTISKAGLGDEHGDRSSGNVSYIESVCRSKPPPKWCKHPVDANLNNSGDRDK